MLFEIEESPATTSVGAKKPSSTSTSWRAVLFPRFPKEDECKYKLLKAKGMAEMQMRVAKVATVLLIVVVGVQGIQKIIEYKDDPALVVILGPGICTSSLRFLYSSGNLLAQ